MKELKMLAILVVIFGVVYWGVEPLAHSIMHPKVAQADYDFKDLPQVALTDGDVVAGKELVLNNCASCHGISTANVPAPLDVKSAYESFGVVPPDLSNTAAILDHHFLANFIKDPVKATLLSHKFKISCEGLSEEQANACNEQNTGKLDYPMNAFQGVLSDVDIKNIIAFLSSIANANTSSKEVVLDTCARCHSIKYDNVEALTPENALQGYLGSKAPDLSIVIRSKNKEFLSKFINNPQHELPGTSMPRLGLSKASQEKVISYLEKVGDSKKQERESLGWKIMLFFAIFTLLAWLWKKKVWRDVH